MRQNCWNINVKILVYVDLILLRSPVLLVELLKFGADSIYRLSPVPHSLNKSLIFWHLFLLTYIRIKRHQHYTSIISENLHDCWECARSNLQRLKIRRFSPAYQLEVFQVMAQTWKKVKNWGHGGHSPSIRSAIRSSSSSVLCPFASFLM